MSNGIAKLEPSVVVVIRRLAKAGKGATGSMAAALTSVVKKVNRSLPKAVRSASAAPPRRLLPMAGAIARMAANAERDLAIVVVKHGEAVALTLVNVMAKARRVNRRITNAVGGIKIAEVIARYAAPAKRLLTREQLAGEINRLAGKAGEFTLLNNKSFLRVLQREADDVARIARDPVRLKELGLKSLDTTPLMFTDVRTAAVRGPADARQLYVDLAVLFRAVGEDGSEKYLLKITGQSKLDNVSGLIGELLEGGKFEAGQLLRDELRGDRGPWYFERIAVPRSAIVKHPDLTKLTFGTREMTAAEQELLRSLGITVEHILHDISHAEFFEWAEAVVKAIGLRVK